MEISKKKQLSFRLDRKTYNRLKKYQAETKERLTTIITQSIKLYLDNYYEHISKGN